MSKLMVIAPQNNFYLPASTICAPLESKNCTNMLFLEVLFRLPWSKDPSELCTRNLNQDIEIPVSKDS